MGYNFTCQLTAQIYQFGQPIGLPLAMAGGWYRFGAESFVVDSEGRLVSAAGAQGTSGLVYQQGIVWRDYSFVVPIIAPRQVNTGAWGICLRFTSPEDYYYLLWDGGYLGWTKPLRLGKVSGGSGTILAETDDRWDGDVFYLVRADLYGSRLLISVNGRVVFDYTDQAQAHLSGAPGILTSSCLGARFGGVYAEGVRPLETSLSLSSALDTELIGPDYAVLLDNAPVYVLFAPQVQAKSLELGVPLERLFVYRYRISTADVFIQPYFGLDEPVTHTASGNCLAYAYLKARPRAPEAPANFRGTLDGNAIVWRWEDRSVVEQGYRLYDNTGRLIVSLGSNVTQYREEITEDGVTYTRRLTAYNNVGESAPVEASLYVDVVPPAAPAWFSGSGLSQTSIVWQWAAVPNAEAYELYDEQNNLLAVMSGGTVSYTESGLQTDQVYTRFLVAYRKGIRSAPVAAVANTLPEAVESPPPPPTGFSGTALSGTAIRWTWEYTYACTGFILYDQDGTIIAELDKEARVYVEENLTPDRMYTRHLRVRRDALLSDPVSAAVSLEWDFTLLPCPEYPPPVRQVPGFASGIGDGDDLLTSVEPGVEAFRCTVIPVRVEEETEETYAPVPCAVRFTAEGTEPYTVDNGHYKAELSVCPEVEVAYTVQAEAVEPVDLVYRVEADVQYLACDPTEIPFSCAVKGYGIRQDAPSLTGTYQAHCRANATAGVNATFSYQLKVVYQGPPSPQNRPLVDIVWIIDYSGSMGSYMSAVASNATTFFNALSGHNLDFRLGVVAYEITASKRLAPSNGADWTTSITDFQSMVQIPTSGGTENGLSAIQYALNNYSYRTGATRYLVILTDENADDYSSSLYSTVLSRCQQTGTVVAAIYNPGDPTPYPDLVGATGGIGINISTSDWGQSLANLAANIASVATIESTIGSGGSGDPALTATARYGAAYQETDGRTLRQIVTDYLNSGGNRLPADLYTNSNYVIEGYELIPPSSSSLFVRLSNGSLQDTTGNTTIQAYSTATVTQEVALSSGDLVVSVPATAYGPATAVLAISQTCREILTPVIQQYLNSHPEVLSLVPTRYWCAGSGNVVAFNTLHNGEDSPLVYRRDWTNVVVTYETTLNGTVTPGHTATNPLVVDARQAQEILDPAVPVNVAPIREFSVLPRLVWRRGYAPFDGFNSSPYCTPYVLVNDPSLCYFVKDIWLEGNILSAEMRIGSDDGMILYVNGQEVLNRRTDAHGVHYWDYTCDIRPFLRQGRNRIAVLVDNAMDNAGSASGGFDAELAVNINGTVTYPIKSGKYNWRSPESVWWYYGHESTVDIPPADVFGRPWYHQDYGLVDLHAVRVESLTPGVVAYINGAGQVCAYPTVELNTCDTPISCTCTLEISGSGVDYSNQLAAWNYTHPAWALKISGPATTTVSPEQAIAALTPLADFHIAACGLIKVANLQYNASVTGQAGITAWHTYGRCPVVVSTSASTYSPSYVSIVVQSDPYTYAGLRDSATAYSPADVSGGVYARDLLAPYIGNTPLLMTHSYTVLRYRAVLLSGEAVVSTAEDGSSPVFAYPTRSTDYTGSWLQTVKVYAYEGDKIVATTTDYVPVDKMGRAYTGSKTTWTLAGANLPADARVFWTSTGSSGSIALPSAIAVATSRKASKTIEGVATCTPTLYDTSDLTAQFPAASNLLLHLKVLEKRENVFLYLAGAPEVALTQEETVSAIDNVVVKAKEFVYTRPWQIHGPWHQVVLNADGRQTVSVLLDLAVPPHVQDVTFGYEAQADVPVAASFASGGQRTGNPQDVLLLDCDYTQVMKRARLVHGVPVYDRCVRTLAAGEETRFTVAVPEGYWPPGTGIKDLILETDNPNVGLTVIAQTEVDVEPGTAVDNHLGDIPNYPLWRFGGHTLESLSRTLPGLLLSVKAVVCEVLARVVNARAVPLNPVVGDGFYYINGEERYLHGAAAVFSRKTGPVPVVREAACLVNIYTATGEMVPAFEFSCSCPADGAWHELTSSTLIELYRKQGGEAQIDGFEVIPAVPGLELAYDRAGSSTVSGRLPLELGDEEQPLTPFVEQDMTVSVLPGLVGDGPVTVTTTEGQPLRYAPFFDTYGLPVLENTEQFKGGGTDTVALAYLGIDQATLRVDYRPPSGQWVEIKRFQLCNHRLRLPFALKDDDLLQVTYRLRDSFNFRREDDGLTIMLHTSLVSPGDRVLVRYETSAGRCRKFAGTDVSPLRCFSPSGFIWLQEARPSGVNSVYLKVWPDRVVPGYPLSAHAVVADETGYPLAEQLVTFICGDGVPVETLTDTNGVAAVSLTAPALPGLISVSAVCGGMRSSVEVVVEQPEQVIQVAVIPAASAVPPGTELPVFVIVYDEQANPLAGYTIALLADRGTISAPITQTDALGRVFAVFTAGAEEGLVTITASVLVGGRVVSGLGRIMIKAFISVKPVVDNRLEDIPNYSIGRLGSYSLDALAHTPPSWL